jgi:hypothetical protein
LNDLQQALSAREFLYECDETQTYSKIELRRFRCYETTLVVAYARLCVPKTLSELMT